MCVFDVAKDGGSNHRLSRFTIEYEKLQKAWPEKNCMIPLPHCNSVWRVNESDQERRVLTVQLWTRESNCGCEQCAPLNEGAIKHFSADALLQ